MIVIGTKCRLEETVTEALTAQRAGSGSLPVFGTPFMAALMENAAQTCLQNYNTAVHLFKIQKSYRCLSLKDCGKRFFRFL